MAEECVCVCMCVCVCEYVCGFVCISVCMCARVYLRTCFALTLLTCTHHDGRLCMECAMCKQYSNCSCIYDHIILASVTIVKVRANVRLTIIEIDQIAGSVAVAFK